MYGMASNRLGSPDQFSRAHLRPAATVLSVSKYLCAWIYRVIYCGPCASKHDVVSVPGLCPGLWGEARCRDIELESGISTGSL